MRNAFFGSCLAVLLGVALAGPAAAAAAARPEAPVLKAQVLLARAGFSPGPIDARAGDNFANALRAFEVANGSQPGTLDDAAWARLEAFSGAPLLVSYTIQPQDVAGPFLPRIPQDYRQMATLPHLYYRSPRQLLAAKFHMSEGLLDELNPGKNFAVAGTVITVVNVDASAPNASPATTAAAPATGQNPPATAASPAGQNAPTTAGQNAPNTAAPAVGQNAPNPAAPAVAQNAPNTAAPAAGQNAPKTAAPAVAQNAPNTAAPAVAQNAPNTAAPAGGQNTPNTAAPAVGENAPAANGPASGSSAPRAAAAGRPAAAVWVEVDKRQRAVLVHGADNRLIAFYPATIGSAEKPAPSGTFRVRSIVRNPTYTYNPRYHFKGQHATRPVKVEPGPNNPVGLVWIGLSDPGYGIHGAPDPEAVGKTQSHGCVRLTNWDALALARLVRKGTPVVFTG